MRGTFLIETGTLVVEDSGQGLMLCLDAGKTSLPLALFVSAAAAREFTIALAHIQMKAHAAGRSGI